MGLPQQGQRVTVDGLRDIGNPKYDLKNAVGRGIINVNKVKLKSLPNIITQKQVVTVVLTVIIMMPKVTSINR